MDHKRILIVAITRMGDLLQASPTIVGLKKQYPDSRLTIIVDTQFASICRGIPGIDEVYLIDMNLIARGISIGGDMLIESFNYVSKLVNDMRERNFDYCLNMSNSAYTALLIKMLNIPSNRGWLADDEGFKLMADPWAMLFSAFVYHSNRDYNGLNLVDIFRCAAEVNQHPRHLCYNVTDSATEKIKNLLPASFLSKSEPLIAIQVGASQEKRQWSPKRFALLVKYLIEDLSANIVYTGAPSEAHLIEAVSEHYVSSKAISIVGKTSVEDLAAFLKMADVLITGDTGPMHVSVAVGTPVVALFLASALCFETGPYSAGNFVVQPMISCNPCNPNYPCARPDCHDYISPELMAYLTKLRLKTPSDQDKFINIPQDIAPPELIRVYRTEFDEDGFLLFTGMNGLSAHSGYEKGYLETARAAYRVLWKQEFAGIRCPEEINAWEKVALIDETEDLIKLADNACKQLELLRNYAKNPHSTAGEISAVSQELERIDSQIEQFSLIFPILGAIARIFIMEKENIRGEDIILLSEKAEELYRKLGERVKAFRKYFSYFSASFMQKEIVSHGSNFSR
ncbi:MAG TPA: glycosyltransferase family 9 protein [Oligoflexia bacterium]|nr:glycosyltransferase family 9 protein [Oligoflexia bacterium]HMP47642.1 glycosyltransferase family 9 protein [Oligoflexia bacterium]